MFFFVKKIMSHMLYKTKSRAVGSNKTGNTYEGERTVLISEWWSAVWWLQSIFRNLITMVLLLPRKAELQKPNSA